MEPEYATVAYVNSLFGVLCAYWAQTTQRNPWLWFFMGFLFEPITGIVLASRNAGDLKKTPAGP